MKTIALFALLPLLSFAAPVLPPPSNAPPVVQLTWTLPLDTTVTNYFVWYGVVPGQYTNKTAVGNVLQASVTLPARGTTYYFVVTAFNSSGLEGPWSNEVNWTPAAPPGAPTMKPPITLAVKTKSTINAQWADAGMNWSLTPTQAVQYFGLEIATANPQVSFQVKQLHKELPPLPFK